MSSPKNTYVCPQWHIVGGYSSSRALLAEYFAPSPDGEPLHMHVYGQATKDILDKAPETIETYSTNADSINFFDSWKPDTGLEIRVYWSPFDHSETERLLRKHYGAPIDTIIFAT